MTSLVIPREHNILEISGLSCSICMTISFSSLYSQDFSSLFYEFSLSLSLSLSLLLGKKRWNGCFDTCLFLPPTRFVSHTRIRVVEKQKLKGHRYGIRKIVWKSLVEKTLEEGIFSNIYTYTWKGRQKIWRGAENNWRIIWYFILPHTGFKVKRWYTLEFYSSL